MTFKGFEQALITRQKNIPNSCCFLFKTLRVSFVCVGIVFAYIKAEKGMLNAVKGIHVCLIALHEWLKALWCSLNDLNTC